MNHRIIIDAGPALNFFATRQERTLFGAVGPVAAPSTVVNEIRAKSRQDRRFHAAAGVLDKLSGSLLRVLPDEETPELAAAVGRICQVTMAQRVRTARDLGETMVIAHAAIAAESRLDVCAPADRVRAVAAGRSRDACVLTLPSE